MIPTCSHFNELWPWLTSPLFESLEASGAFAATGGVPGGEMQIQCPGSVDNWALLKRSSLGSRKLEARLRLQVGALRAFR